MPRAAVAAAALFGAGPAAAQVVIVGDLYEDTAIKTCASNTDFCQIVFTATPADKLVALRAVHCRVSAGKPLISAGISEAPSANANLLNRSVYLPLPDGVTSGAKTYYSIAEDVRFAVRKGQFPTFFVATDGDSATVVNCRLIGRLITAGSFF